MLDIITKHLEDYAAGRWDQYKAVIANDAMYEEPATRFRASGADAYVKAVRRWKSSFSDLRAKVIAAFESGDRVVLEVEWEGTQDGPFESPFGTIQATNKFGTTRAALLFTMKNGKIVELHHYFDLLGVLAQLGLMPAVGAMAQPAKAAPVAPTKH